MLTAFYFVRRWLLAILWDSVHSVCRKYKVGCVFQMIISSEFRTRQYRDDDHREDAPLFIYRILHYHWVVVERTRPQTTIPSLIWEWPMLRRPQTWGSGFSFISIKSEAFALFFIFLRILPSFFLETKRYSNQIGWSNFHLILNSFHGDWILYCRFWFYRIL